jgi:hypothetical protein
MSNDIIENDRIKQRCAEKVLLEQDQLGLMNLTVAKYLGVTDGEVSSIKREAMYKYVTKTSWRKIHDWYNSGLTLEQWYNKRIKESEGEDTSEQSDEAPGATSTGTIPDIKRTGVSKPEQIAENGKPPTEEKPPAPDFKHEKEVITIPAKLEITKHVFHPEKPKGKPGPKSKDKPGSTNYEKYNKPAPSKEEIERVLATLGIEIEVVVKLKNKEN